MRLRLSPTATAPGEARRKLEFLGEWIDEDSLAKVRSVVSELLGISVAYGAAQPIEMSLDLDDGELQGTLTDRGVAAKAVARARRRQDESLVLRIIDLLAEDWGPDAEQTGIWFRLAVEPIA